jgi:hypothetical protein
MTEEQETHNQIKAVEVLAEVVQLLLVLLIKFTVLQDLEILEVQVEQD